MLVRIADGTRLFVDVVGSGLRIGASAMEPVPTVLTVHGGPGADHSTFRPALDDLADVARVVHVDLRGQGRSAGDDPEQWNLRQWARDLVELADTLGIQRPVIVAESAGTYVALRCAVDAAGFASGYFLLSAAGRVRPDRGAAVFERLGGPAAAEAATAFWSDPNPRTRAAFLRLCRPLYGNLSGRITESSMRIVSRPEVYAHFATTDRHTYDVLGELDAVTEPVMILNGTDDPVTTIDDARDLAAALGERATLHELPGCGHGLLEEAPQQVMERLRHFLHTNGETHGDTR